MSDCDFIEESICKNCKNFYLREEKPWCKEKDKKIEINWTCSLFEKREEPLSEPLFDVKAVLQKWLFIQDLDIIDIVLATAIGEKIPGDPLWIYLIAPPGGCKSELLRALRDGEMFYHLSNLTPQTFVSGLMVGEGKERRKVEDLLPQLNRKSLIIKDFTVILEKSRDERKEIISQLRDIYDGQYSKKFGSIDKKITYNSRFGLIAGVTPAIDRHWKIEQQLGERFLKVRWNENLDLVTRKAEQNEGKEEQMREEISKAVMDFLSRLNIHEVKVTGNHIEYIINLAKLVALGRTPVAVKNYYSDFSFENIPISERPTRLVKQLKKLLKCLCIVRGHPEPTNFDIQTIKRVALDCIPQDRLIILKAIAEGEYETLNGLSFTSICNKTKIPKSTLHKILQQLYRLDLIEPNGEEGTDIGFYKLKFGSEILRETNEQALTPLTLYERHNSYNVGGYTEEILIEPIEIKVGGINYGKENK